MAYYVIFDVTIHDLPKYQEYMARIKPVIEAAGGRYLVRGGAHMVMEGDWKPTRLVVFEPRVPVAQGAATGGEPREHCGCRGGVAAGRDPDVVGAGQSNILIPKES
jgi:hypothetical protein